MQSTTRWIAWTVFSMNTVGVVLSAPAEDQGKIVIEGPRRAAQAFPLVLRIVAKGPLEVPRASLYSNAADVRVSLSQEDGAKTRTLESNASIQFDVAGKEGRIIANGRGLVNERIRAEQQMAVLLDLSSLHYVEGGSFRDLPPGQYLLSVTFPHAKQTSEAMPLDLIAPSPADRAFLDEILEPGAPPSRPRAVVWARVLRGARFWPIPVAKTKGLLDPAKGQLQFHVLVYQIEKGEVRTREQAAAYPVPKYLELEKDWILLKLDRANKVAGAEEALQAFVGTHPEFRWRLRPAYPGSNLFQNIAN